MPQETPERLVLAAVVAFNDQSLVTSFLSNQGFAAAPGGAQVVADALGIAYTHVLILRPEDLPATPNNMLVRAGMLIGPSVPPVVTNMYDIAGPAGFTAPFGAATIAAGQPGDIAIALPAMPAAGDGRIAVVVFQITPAD